MKVRGTGCLVLAMTLCGACGNTAVVRTRSGETIRGAIDAGGERTLVVKTAQGARVKVQRSEITDIEHPGSTATTIGVLLAIYGVVNAAVYTPKCRENDAAFCVGVYTPLTIGLAVTVYGLAVHSASVSETARPSGGEPYSAPRKAPTPPQDGDSPWRRTSLLYLGPTAIVTPTSVATGLGLAARF